MPRSFRIAAGRSSVKPGETTSNDEIDARILEFFSEFAAGSRYFNLDALATFDGVHEKAQHDPLGVWDDLLREVYEHDVPYEKRLGPANEIDILVDHIEGNACLKATADGCIIHTQTEHDQDHAKMALALPQMNWRLMKRLVLLRSLAVAICEKIRATMQQDDDDGVPYLQEFLDFVCEDKNVVVETKDWL